MPECPLLPLPAFERGDPPGAPRFVPRVPKLPSGRQAQRLGPIFERLAHVLAEERDGLSLRDDPSSIAPERALVLEVAGSLVDFQALVARVDGLEFLGDEEIEFDPDEGFFEVDTRTGREGERRRGRRLGGRLYLAMPDAPSIFNRCSGTGRGSRRGAGRPRCPTHHLAAGRGVARRCAGPESRAIGRTSGHGRPRWARSHERRDATPSRHRDGLAHPARRQEPPRHHTRPSVWARASADTVFNDRRGGCQSDA